MAWKITFNIIGDTFDASTVNIDFDEVNVSTDIAKIGKNRGEPYGYGSASYTVPDKISRLMKFKHLANLFEPKLEEIRLAGAESCWVEIGRLYHNQCNEELDIEELKQIARLECSLSYSAYSVSEEDLELGWDH